MPEAVILDWDYQSSVVNPFSWRIVAPRVYIEYIRVESLDYNLRLVASRCRFAYFDGVVDYTKKAMPNISFSPKQS